MRRREFIARLGGRAAASSPIECTTLLISALKDDPQGKQWARRGVNFGPKTCAADGLLPEIG